jgi:hypothetical protein
MSGGDLTAKLVEGLVRSLTEGGFLQTREQTSASFGDYVAEYELSPLKIRVVRDRDQWRIEIHSMGREGWFDVDIWRACVEKANAPTLPRSFKEQSEYLLSHLAALRRSASDESTAGRLGEIGHDRIMRYFEWERGQRNDPLERPSNG